MSFEDYARRLDYEGWKRYVESGRLSAMNAYTVKGVEAIAAQVATINQALTEAHSLHAGDRTLVCCVMCMTQESSCLPLNYGDRDSLGPYQQRTPWGPVWMRESPAGSTRLFLLSGETGEAGFRAYYSIPDGPPSNVPLDEAVQRVQDSDFPYAYGQWQSEAERTVATWLASLPKPKTMHYERYPKAWRANIEHYDRLRNMHTLTRSNRWWLERRQRQCRTYLTDVKLEADKLSHHGHANWDDHRGWMFQQLRPRANGRRAQPTE